MPAELLLPAHTEATPTGRPYNTEKHHNLLLASPVTSVAAPDSSSSSVLSILNAIFANHRAKDDEAYVQKSYIS
ncbi:hypothetical protein E2C01_042506 [Portunus trituberculatus]|uniref:Uncharacterized protein n=1 Tax=Portunus trituberculatus TaxID=210409 RepID=A0A5B7FTU2_PORTR|nr:hypothetical protein [Portunus trituberculatus]